MNNMENTLKLYFKREINLLKTSYKNFNNVVLTKSEKDLLEEKISKLPYREKILLYMKYIFCEDESNIKEILDTNTPNEDIIFLETLLLSQLGYNERKLDYETFKSSVENIYNKELEEDEEIEEVSHIYSEKFINTMRNLGLEKPKKRYKFIKKVALFFLIATISITVFLGTNSAARKFIMDYLITENSDHKSIRNLPSENKELNVDDIEISYLPEGYELDEVFVLEHTPGSIVYKYIKHDSTPLYIDINTTSVHRSIATEIEEEKIEYKNNHAYYIEGEESFTEFIYYENSDISVGISTTNKDIKKDEMIKIADEIKINQK